MGRKGAHPAFIEFKEKKNVGGTVAKLVKKPISASAACSARMTRPLWRRPIANWAIMRWRLDVAKQEIFAASVA